MASLFDLPQSRNNKGTDSIVVNKTTNKRSAPIVMRGGGLLERITSINALVESKIGKYKDEYDYFMADDENKFKDYISHIIENGDYAIDTETTGLNPFIDTIVGLSLYTKGEKGIYIPLHHKSYITQIEVEGQLDSKLVGEQLKRLSNAKARMYNASFDKLILKRNLNVDVPCWFDAHLAAMCLNENEPHGLKTLHSKYVLNGEEDEFSFGKLFEGITFDLVPIKTGYIYAARDAVDTDELVDFQLPFLTETAQECIEQGLQDVSKVFWNIEMPYVDVVCEMRENGITLDTEYAQELSQKYHKILDENLQNFYDELTVYSDKINSYVMSNINSKLSNPININSPTQLAILFYDIIKVEPPDKEHPRGTGEEILEKIDLPICKAILEYRATAKLLSTYIDKMPDVVLSDGKVRANFNQYGARTGRLSSDDPNLQNIPSHNKDIRKMFVASDGYILMSGDFSQQEPKVMTAMCKDPEMIKAYKEGRDLYASIASVAMNKSYEDCLEFYLDENGKKTDKVNKEGKERRQSAKSIFLGLLYGRGINSISEQLNTTKEKAQQIQDKVFKEFPAIKQFEQDTLEMAKTLGYVTTFWGRKRRLPDMQLPEYEFKYKDGYGDLDPLSFDSDDINTEVPYNIQKKYLTALHNAWGKDKQKVKEDALKEGIIIVDNGGKIADATRQCVNSRVQGSAADMSKIAGIKLLHNDKLKKLGFRILIPIHDEYLCEAPIENAKECAELFSQCMCEAATDLNLPISVDIDCSYKWYGEKLELNDL